MSWLQILLLALIVIIGLTTGYGLVTALVAIPIYLVKRT